MHRFLFACIVMSTAAILAAPLSFISRADAAPRGLSLNAKLPQAKLIGIPLSDAFTFLHDLSGANINVDWKTLEALNISKDTSVNVNLRNVTLGKVLSLVLSEAGGDLLTYYAEGNVIQVTSRAVADQKIIVVVYYVDDLLSLDDTFDYTVASNFNPAPSGGGGGTGGGGGGGTSSIFGGGAGQNSGASAATTKAQKAANLIKMIQSMVRPEVWKDNGGVAQIVYFNGNLVIAAPRSVQELIGGPIH